MQTKAKVPSQFIRDMLATKCGKGQIPHYIIEVVNKAGCNKAPGHNAICVKAIQLYTKVAANTLKAITIQATKKEHLFHL